MPFNSQQSNFLTDLKAGKSIFLTGKAGTGKSYVVKAGIDMLRSQGRKFIALAPTGVAANNIGGQTIHSMFSITPFGVATFKTANWLKQEKRRLLEHVDTIFIDEVSMLRPDVLDAINWTLIKNGCKRLHELQIIFIGDLKQLPSPIDDNTRSVLYQSYRGEEFHHAQVYKHLNVSEIELDEVVRQSDSEFIDRLNIVRDGGKSPYFKKFVHTEPKGILLAPHNTTVDRYNNEGLDKIDSPEIVFNAEISGNAKATDFNLESVIRVKHEAKIMYLVNSSSAELFNGTLGTFIHKNGEYFIRVKGVDYVLNRQEVTKKEYVLNENNNELELKETGSITQYPIKLAYALSIHKAQGLTFDEVTIDLTRPCFTKGQLYVALSRVTSPDGLRIIISDQSKFRLAQIHE